MNEVIWNNIYIDGIKSNYQVSNIGQVKNLKFLIHILITVGTILYDYQ